MLYPSNIAPCMHRLHVWHCFVLNLDVVSTAIGNISTFLHSILCEYLCKCLDRNIIPIMFCIYTVSGKKETKMFCVISPTKLGQFWWNLAHSFLNKCAATWYKRFSHHLSNVSTLPCETWNAHRAPATIELLDRETPEFIPCQLWSSNSPDFNPVDNSVWKILQERVQNMHHWSGAIDDATDEWLPQWWCDPACSTPFSVAVSVRPDQWCIFFLHILLRYFSHSVISWIQIWRIWRPQLRWDKFWSFFLYQLSGSTCALSISSFTG